MEERLGWTCIPKDEYRKLLEKSMVLDIVLGAAYEGARLNYNEKELALDDDVLVVVLKQADADRYDSIFRKLKKQKEEEEKKNETV